MDISRLTIKDIRQGLQNKEFSAKEIALAFLNNIEKKNRDLRAYLTISKDLALTQANNIDKKIAANENLPPLAGIPLAIKDNILVEGETCTAASKVLENYTASYDATVVKKLKESGAVILGKTNLDEFAMGSSTENSAFGPTRNPYDKERVPGGSSGGSAAAVAAGLAVGALGSHTGGSIRLPASFCGVVGLKPTYGAVSRFGLIAMASSLDQIGPFARTVQDAKAIFDVIKGTDPLDSTSVEPEIQNSKFKIQNLKIGVPKEYFIKGLNPEVEKRIQEAISYYEKQGAKIEQISLPHTKYALPAYYIIMPCEVSANLARYDGIKYGKSKFQNLHDKEDPKFQTQNLLDVYLETRREYLGPEVKRRIMVGTFALSSGYYDAYYLRAQKVRTKIKEDFDQAFQEVDLILTPIAPNTAFKIGERISDPVQMYLSDIFTVSVNLAALPAISVPAGIAAGLPVGFQLIAPAFQEELLLKTASAYQK